MSTTTGKDLNLVKPELTDQIDQTIGTDLPNNFQTIDDRFTEHKADTATDDVHSLLTDGKIIEESGSNANGEYVRFADGMQICWRIFEETGDGVATYFSRSDLVWPASFIDIFVAQVHYNSGYTVPADSGNRYAQTGIRYGSLSMNYWWNIKLGAALPDGHAFYVAVVAIGRWK